MNETRQSFIRRHLTVLSGLASGYLFWILGSFSQKSLTAYTRPFKNYIVANQGQAMQDQCVYARSLLGRLVSTYSSTSTPQYSQSQTQSTESMITPGSVMMIAAILLLLFINLKNKRKASQPKPE